MRFKVGVQVLRLLFTAIPKISVCPALLFGTLISGAVGYAQAENNTAKLSPNPTAKQQQQQQKLRQDIKSVENALLKIQQNKSDHTQQLQLNETHISKLSTLIRTTNSNLQRQSTRLKSMRSSKTKLEKQANHYRQQLALQLRSSHALGKREYIKILLSSQNPADISRMLTYLNYLNRQQLELIQQAAFTSTELKNTETAIIKRQKKLANQQLRQQTDLERLNQSKQNRKQLISKLSQKIASNKQTLKNDQIALRQLMNQLLPQKNLNATTLKRPKTKPALFKNLKGTLKRPSTGKIIRKFGQKQIGNITSNGVVFASPVNQPVLAVAAGQVVYSDWLRGFGMLMILDHGNQYMTLYGQNTSLHYEPGDWVQAEEVIASTGNSGGGTQSGLYFELRHRGEPLNPSKWLKR